MAVKTMVMLGKGLYQIGMITLITSLMWTGIAVWDAAHKSTKVEIKATILEPLNPSIEMSVVEELARRRQVSGMSFVPRLDQKQAASPSASTTTTQGEPEK